MFSQTKPSQPTFKIIIRSDLTSASASNKNDDQEATLKPTSPDNSIQQQQPQSDPSPPETTTTGDIERKRKHADKEGGLLATKKVCAQLGRWNQKREELQVSQQEGEVATDYGDYELLACLLCSRKFKSKQDVTRHQALSDLHKKNSLDPMMVEKARIKLEEKLNTMEPLEVSLSNSYRNRAAERRQAYHQPERPSLDDHFKKPPPITQTNNKKSYESASSMSIPMKDDNIGAKMLKQMGWRNGQGLGKEGSGITNPIAAERYTQGAGLGSANTKSRLNGDTYKERARELARRRLQEEL
ncbi:G-patch domain-containing protein [Chlamydoabsidia padenii]|nr:G-patch domain-containing protein [Chlamydoabsidia padenii]